jgi:hypothetical protein
MIRGHAYLAHLDRRPWAFVVFVSLSEVYATDLDCVIKKRGVSAPEWGKGTTP